MEEFRDIKGYEGFYQISSLGRVKSLSRLNSVGSLIKEKILKSNIGSHGYLLVGLHKNSKRKTKNVHQLVAIAFLGHEPNGHKGLVTDHKDNNPLNNNKSNLQLITNRENASKDQKNGSSKYIGVCWSKDKGKWESQISINGKTKKLGRFNNELEASEVYQKELKTLTLIFKPIRVD